MMANHFPSYDDLESGPLIEPSASVAGHKVYRKEACTMDHRAGNRRGGITTTVPARRYLGLWQCAACGGIVAPTLRHRRAA